MNFFRILYDFLAYIVMIANVSYLTSKYLAYDCDTNSAPYFPSVLVTPRFSVCFDLLDIVRPGHRKMTWLNFNLTETFDDIFSSMPLPRDLIASCSHRNLTLDVMVDVDDVDLCTDLLQVSRFKMQGFLCYKFELFDQPTYSFHTVVNSLYQPRELYSVTLKGPMTQLNTFYPILHIADYPDEDRAFERDRYKNVNSMFHLTYSMYESHSLPAPYESQCIEWSILSCFQLCMDLALEPYGFVSDSSLVIEDSDEASRRLMPLGHNVSSRIGAMRKGCYKQCSFEDCSSKIVNTDVSPPYESGGMLKFVVEAIDRPVSKIEQTPKLLLVDYVTQVCSVIGIWVGINFTSITDIFHRKTNYSVLVNVRVNLYLKNIRKLLAGRLSKEIMRICEKPRARNAERTANSRSGYILWKTVIIITVIALFNWQVINSASRYFRYATTVRFKMLLNTKASVPVIAFCVDYGDALGFDQSTAVTESNYDEHFSRIASKINSSFSSLFAELHDEKILDGCYFRNWTDRMKPFQYHNKTVCLKQLKLKHFYLSQSFCFEVRPRVLTIPFYQSDIRFLLVKPSVIYTVQLGSNFTFKSVQIYSYLRERFPGWSTEPVTLNNSTRKREISISNRLFVNHLLEAPYDTNCNPTVSISRCYVSCLNQSIGDTLYPFIIKEDQNVSAKIFYYEQLADEKIYTKWRQDEERCEGKCHSERCQNNFTTAVYSGSWPVDDHSLRISVESQSALVNVISAVPVMLLYDLLYNVMCCFSFWLGFSFTAINPLTLIADSDLRRIEGYAKMRFVVLRRLIRKLMPFPLPRSKSRTRIALLGRPSWQQLTSILVHSVAALACFAHSVYSLKIYLGYPTSIDVAQAIETDTDFSLILCLDTAEVFARDEGMDMYNLTNVERTRLLNRTVTEIFEKTPHEDTIIQGCSHWGLTSRRGKVQRMQNLTDRILFYTRNASTCYDHYFVRKEITSSLICYHFVPKNFTDWTMMTFRNALQGYKIFFTITVNSSILTNRFSLMVGLNIWMPISSSEFAPNFYKDPRYNHYYVSYIKYVSSFLPTPYPNKDFNPFMYDRCVSGCVNEALISKGKTFSTRFDDPKIKSNLTFFNMADRQEEGASERFRTLVSGCEKSCSLYNDRTVAEKISRFPIYVPSVASSWSTTHIDMDQVLLQLIMTRIPVFYITFTLKISLFEQVINLGSIVSIWFGFSAISLARLRKMRQRQITSQDFDEMDQQLRLLKIIYGSSAP